jgi:hypothetical protein
VFWPTWQQAFSPANTASGFAKTGIWPYALDKILTKIIKLFSINNIAIFQIAKTPIICRAVRRAQREFRNTPNSPLLDKIFRANKRLAAQYSID